MQTRQNTLNEWLQLQLNHQPFTLTPLTGDASFRRYFRLSTSIETKIVMDAPPDKESIAGFIHIHRILKNIGLLTPTVHAADLEQGFAILDDLGDQLFLNMLNTINQDGFYSSAIHTLIQMQHCSTHSLPTFDKPHMLKEMSLFHDWFLQAYLKLTLTTDETNVLNDTFHHIADRIAHQPQVFIHRDYHSRNLMITEKDKQTSLAIIDFQDAMCGPITYDLVSLLKDCYIKLPETSYQHYLELFYQHQPLAQTWSLQTLNDEVDYCGLQRHLKVLGIFCRLHLRDKKPNYLRDLPLTMDYTLSCLKRHPEFDPLLKFVETRVLSQFMETCEA